ncbi:MAG: carboxylesterase family protein [Pseudomonadota bacterium]
MKSRVFVALLLTALAGCSDTPVQLTSAHGVIEGREADGVKRFLGIPYAMSTSGELRWAPPEEVPHWDKVLDATQFGPWCPQPDFDRREEGEVHSGEGWTIFVDVPPNVETSEDCLSLNVWAPVQAASSPVMVFIHGNALGTSFPAYDGTAFARDGIVFVSINFRLHSMGNFAHPALTRAADDAEPLARYTEMDQLAALRWVQKNIAAFGGDPANVTVVGSSNGGAGILQMLTNETSKGLFHKAIVQSGNGWWAPWKHAQNEQLGCLLASMADLDGCDATLEELRELPWHEFPVTGPYAIDGRYWRRGATELISEGLAVDVPLLIGWNDFDGSSLRYAAQHVIETTHPDVLATYETGLDQEQDLAYEIYTDLHSGAPARWVAHKLEDGEPTYLYMFSYVLSSERGNVRGAEHAYELPHVFDTWDKVLPPIIGPLFISEEDLEMTMIMHACWVSFAATGKPSCPNVPDWPKYNRATDQLMELNLTPTVRTGFRAAQLNAHERHMEHYLKKSESNVEELLKNGL